MAATHRSCRDRHFEEYEASGTRHIKFAITGTIATGTWHQDGVVIGLLATVTFSGFEIHIGFSILVKLFFINTQNINNVVKFVLIPSITYKTTSPSSKYPLSLI